MPLSRDTFLSISAPLTGFEPLDLLGTGRVDEYLAYLQTGALDQLRQNAAANFPKIQVNYQAALDEFAKTADEVEKLGGSDRNKINELIQSRLMTPPPSPSQLPDYTLYNLTANLIRLWYTGTWRWDPANKFSSAPISALAYQSGLVWKAMHSHPQGAKQPGFGSWSQKPLDV